MMVRVYNSSSDFALDQQSAAQAAPDLLFIRDADSVAA
jgi:hypothetical protein